MDAPRLLEIRPSIACKILRRVNRFVVEVEVEGEVHRAYLCNTGRLAEYLVNGRVGFCTTNLRPAKLSRRLFSIIDEGLGAVIDTQIQLKAFEKAIDFVPRLKGCEILRRNIRVGGSILDYLLKCPGGEMILEVKSAAMKIDGYASYPDCPSIRARKQLRDLIEAARRGHRCAMLFIATSSGVRAFKPNCPADNEICALLREASNCGIEIMAITIAYDPSTSFIHLTNPNLKTEL